MLRLDYVTFALHLTVKRMEIELGISFSPPVSTPGSKGRVARLRAGFLEVVTIEDASLFSSHFLGKP